MQQTETRIQMIKMVQEFKLTVVHFACPNPMQICACAWIYSWTKKLWKIRTGPLGHRRALGLWAPGPSQAVGRWAMGLLLAKPFEYMIYVIVSFSFSSRSNNLHLDSNCFWSVFTVYGQ